MHTSGSRVSLHACASDGAVCGQEGLHYRRVAARVCGAGCRLSCAGERCARCVTRERAGRGPRPTARAAPARCVYVRSTCAGSIARFDCFARSKQASPREGSRFPLGDVGQHVARSPSARAEPRGAGGVDGRTPRSLARDLGGRTAAAAAAAHDMFRRLGLHTRSGSGGLRCARLPHPPGATDHTKSNPLLTRYGKSSGTDDQTRMTVDTANSSEQFGAS